MYLIDCLPIHYRKNQKKEYKNCITEPSNVPTRECGDGESACVVDYFHMIDRAFDDYIVCEAGRDCCEFT